MHTHVLVQIVVAAEVFSTVLVGTLVRWKNGKQFSSWVAACGKAEDVRFSFVCILRT